MLPFLEPSSPSKHHSWVDGRLSAASDLLTLALQQIHSKEKSQASDRHCRSVRWRTEGVLGSDHLQPLYARCVIIVCPY